MEKLKNSLAGPPVSRSPLPETSSESVESSRNKETSTDQGAAQASAKQDAVVASANHKHTERKVRTGFGCRGRNCSSWC